VYVTAVLIFGSLGVYVVAILFHVGSSIVNCIFVSL